MRHRADAAVNDTPTLVVRDGREVRVPAREVVIGDVVKVMSDETIPCDCVLISSVNQNGSCFVTTGLDVVVVALGFVQNQTLI